MSASFKAITKIGTRKNKFGKYSIMIRVTLNRKSMYLSLNEKIEDQFWSGKEGRWVKSNHPFAYELNVLVQRRINDLKEFELKQKLFGNNCSLDGIRKYFERRGDRNSFHDFANALVNSIRGKSENTLKLYRTFLKHILEFAPDLTFNQLSEDLFHRFAKWMHHDKGLAGVSTNKYFKPFRIICKQAVKDGYLEKDPFFAVRITDSVPNTKSKNRVVLEIEEIKLFKNVKIPAGRFDLIETRDRWLMCFYAGFYYSDLVGLKWPSVRSTEFGYCIVGTRYKNSNTFIAPIHKFAHAIEIIEMQRGRDPVYVFPEALSEQKFNEKLKELADLAGIEKNLMNKTARHSHIQFWVANGLATQHAMKMVGHTRESTTKEYFELTLRDINNHVSSFDFSNLDI
jgi:site-specific recombinase XerD